MTHESYIEIREYLRDLISGTKWEGHVFAVGGCVRDEIMGLPIKDIDLAVDLPDGGVRFAAWLSGQSLTVGEPVTYPAFGTAMLRLVRFPDVEIELVQTRREKYTNRFSCHPETVHGSLEDDTMRRDLTINAIYFDISNGNYIDLCGHGIDDIHNHIIRTPADPDMTYDDDPLRILRCVRFATRFGWEIEKATFKAMLRNVPRLAILSPRRTAAELDRIITAPYACEALTRLRDIKALGSLIPELEGKLSDKTIAALAALPEEQPLRLTALMLEVFNPRNASSADDIFRALRRLRYDRTLIRRVLFLLRRNRADILSGNADALHAAMESYVPTRSGSRRRRRKSGEHAEARQMQQKQTATAEKVSRQGSRNRRHRNYRRRKKQQ